MWFHLIWSAVIGTCVFFALHTAHPSTDSPKYQFLSPQKFPVTPELEKRIQFWQKVFGEWDEKTVVLHDEEFPYVIYTSIDLTKETLENHFHYPNLPKRILPQVQEKVSHILEALRKNHLLHDIESEKRFNQLIEKHPELYTKLYQLPSKERWKERPLRWQFGLKNRLHQAIKTSRIYRPDIMQVLRSYGVPAELFCLTFVESLFTQTIESSAGAVGIWQLMPFTANPHLAIHELLDERKDPILATHVAARILFDNYKMFQNWPLAITAYNFGHNGLMRMTRSAQTSQLEELINNNTYERWGFAGKNFYAEFIAVARTFKKNQQTKSISSDREFQVIALTHSMNYQKIIRELNISLKEFRFWNPSFNEEFFQNAQNNFPKGFHIRIPEPMVQPAIQRKIGEDIVFTQFFPKVIKEPFRFSKLPITVTQKLASLE